MQRFTELTDDQVLNGLDLICANSHELLAGMIGYLIQVETRDLHLKAAYCSMFDYCKRRLKLSNGATFRRLTAARLARAFPIILERIERGQVHLEALVALRGHLTSANVEELLDAVAHKTTQQVEKLVAARFGRPDAPDMLCKLPATDATGGTGGAAGAAGASSAAGTASAGAIPLPTHPSTDNLPASLVLAAEMTKAATGATGAFNPRDAAESPEPTPTAARTARRDSRRQVFKPVADGHFVQLTTGAELGKKIERAQALMRHRNPTGDLETVFDAAMTLLLEKLEKEVRGKTERPQKKVRPSKPGHVPQAHRRAVFERDGEQCAYVAEDGSRCPATELLEIHHVRSKAREGTDEIENLSVRCRNHNLLDAKEVFGRAYIEKKIDFRRRKSIARAKQKACAPPPRPYG